MRSWTGIKAAALTTSVPCPSPILILRLPPAGGPGIRRRTKAWRLGHLATVLLVLMAAPSMAAAPPSAAPVEPLTRIREIRELSTELAASRLAAEIRGTVSTSDAGLNLLFVHDDTGGIYVMSNPTAGYPEFGSQVVITGYTLGGNYLPVVVARVIRQVSDTLAPLPTPPTTPLRVLEEGRQDSEWVSVQGHVVSSERLDGTSVLTIASELRSLEVRLAYNSRVSSLPPVGTEVRITGTLAVVPDADRRPSGLRLFVPRPDLLNVLRPRAQVLSAAHPANLAGARTASDLPIHQVLRIPAQVTASGPIQIWVQDATDAIRCTLPAGTPNPAPDSEVELVAIPLREGPGRRITALEITDKGPARPRVPVEVQARDLFDGNNEARLVQVTATYLHRSPRVTRWVLVLGQDNRTFEAEYPGAGALPFPPALVAGATVKLIGVIRLRPGEEGVEPFASLKLRSAEDLRVIAPPPWPLRRSLAVVTGLVLALVVGLVALWISHRRLREANGRLQQAHATVHQLNQDLEGRVARRTTELGTAILRLEEENQARRRTETELKDRETRLRDAQAIAHVGNFAWSPETGVVGWSEELHRIFGLTPGSCEPSHALFMSLVHTEDRESVQDHIRRAVEHRDPVQHDFRIVRGDGTVRWITARVRTVFNRDGGVEGLEGTCQDVTERKLAEAELLASEQRFNRAFEAGPFATALSRLDPIAILEVNAAFEQLFGYPRQEVIGQDGLSLRLWVDPEQRKRGLETLRTDGRLRGFEMQFRRKDGSTGTALYHVELITINESTLALSMIEDITGRRVLEGQLLQARKLEAVGTLAGGIAHDFNNILGAMLGHAELARGLVTAPLEAVESLDSVLKACGRARDLVRGMLSFSRPQDTERRPVRLQTLVIETLRLVRPTIPPAVILRESLPPDIPPVHGDPTQLQQVLVNLLTNAAQAIPRQEGTIDIQLDLVPASERRGPPQASFEGQSNLVRLTIRDTGVGIPADVLPRIFEPFFTTKPVGQGSGLGLSVVHGIVQAHGGSIDVESSPEAGTRFVLHFVPTSAAPESPATPPKPGRLPVPWRVLLVDDESGLNVATSRLLRRAGFQVRSCLDPIEALETFRADPEAFDLVLTDFSMPRQNGFELGLELLRIRPGVPVLLCSGYASHVNQEKALEAGFAGLLLKPVDPADLQTAIRSCLESRPIPASLAQTPVTRASGQTEGAA